jgi:hypothetical protein
LITGFGRLSIKASQFFSVTSRVIPTTSLVGYGTLVNFNLYLKLAEILKYFFATLSSNSAVARWVACGWGFELGRNFMLP